MTDKEAITYWHDSFVEAVSSGDVQLERADKLEAKNKSLKEALDSPEKWMAWCDEKVLEENQKLKATIEAYKQICEEYIPAGKMDEANNKVVLLCMGKREAIGIDLLRGEK